MADFDLRELLTETAVVAVRESQRTLPRVVWLSGAVEQVNLAAGIPPEVGVRISGYASLVWAQALVAIPNAGDTVLVIFASPAQAFTIPFAPTSV
jgi:hypothetical protein